MPQENKEKLNVWANTIVFCPRCGKRTGSRLGAGNGAGYCRHCKIEIEVTIRVIERTDLEGDVNGD